ncbi:MAG: efflux RND transporter periplasmic adaptor subunit [Alphaproteobacteria bacterium]
MTRWMAGLSGAVALLTLAACGDDAGKAGPGRGGPSAPVPVIAYVVTEGELTDRIEAIGTLRANESLTLSAQVTEKVTRVNFEDGQVVERGDILVEFTSVEEGAQLAEAQATLREAKQQLERIRGLVQRGNSTEARLDEQQRVTDAAQARINAIAARMADRLVRAPFDGVLGFRQVSPGTLVAPGDPIATLDDIDPIKLDFSVPETFLGVLRPGLMVEAKSAAYGDDVFKGIVTALDSRIDPITRAVTIRAIIPNEDRLLRPGMLVTVNLVRDQRQALVVPEETLIPRATRQFVMVIGDDGIVERREVGIGARRPGLVEITRGLSAGETVIVEGTTRAMPGGEVTVQEFRTLDGREG